MQVEASVESVHWQAESLVHVAVTPLTEVARHLDPSTISEPPHKLVLVLFAAAVQVRPSQQLLGYPPALPTTVSSQISPAYIVHAAVVVASVVPVPVVVESEESEVEQVEHVPLQQLRPLAQYPILAS